MILATIVLSVLFLLTLLRILSISKEVKELDVASASFGKTVQSWRESSGNAENTLSPETPKEVQEAQTEFEWAINARDSKKESRSIWLGASALSLIALGTAIVELLKNSK